ncbi:MAG: hypothetical protein C0456_06335 [Hyphomonas sp.]|nr:hypothetical protein [Hyphomonas sp.]
MAQPDASSVICTKTSAVLSVQERAFLPLPETHPSHHSPMDLRLGKGLRAPSQDPTLVSVSALKLSKGDVALPSPIDVRLA